MASSNYNYPQIISLEQDNTGITLEMSTSIRCFDYCPKRQLIASGSYNVIKILDADTLDILNDLQGHENLICRVKYSDDSQYIVSASVSTQKVKSMLIVWDATTYAQLGKIVLSHGEFIQNIEFSGCGQNLVITFQNQLEVWNWKSGTQIKIIQPYTVQDHDISISQEYLQLHENIRQQFFNCSLDARFIVQNSQTWASSSGMIYVDPKQIHMGSVRKRTSRRIVTRYPRIGNLQISSDSTKIAVGIMFENKLSLLMWDFGSRKLIRSIKSQIIEQPIRFSDDSRFIYSSRDKRFKKNNVF